MNDLDYEAWRPALIAYYKADCFFQSAANLELHGYPLGVDDKRLIRGLIAAFELAPRAMRKAA